MFVSKCVAVVTVFDGVSTSINAFISAIINALLFFILVTENPIFVSGSAVRSAVTNAVALEIPLSAILIRPSIAFSMFVW